MCLCARRGGRSCACVLGVMIFPVSMIFEINLYTCFDHVVFLLFIMT